MRGMKKNGFSYNFNVEKHTLFEAEGGLIRIPVMPEHPPTRIEINPAEQYTNGTA